MKAKELHGKSVDELAKLLDEKQLNAFRLGMAQATGQLAATHEVRANRRDIARIKTLINQKRGEA